MVVCAERLRRYPVEVELAGPTPVHHPRVKLGPPSNGAIPEIDEGPGLTENRAKRLFGFSQSFKPNTVIVQFFSTN